MTVYEKLHNLRTALKVKNNDSLKINNMDLHRFYSTRLFMVGNIISVYEHICAITEISTDANDFIDILKIMNTVLNAAWYHTEAGSDEERRLSIKRDQLIAITVMLEEE